MTAVVVGVANLQASLPVDGFPVPYSPARYLPGQIVTSVGGVGFNVARTLSGLGEAVRLMAPLGQDVPAAAVLAEAARLGIDTAGCTHDLTQTPRSVILHAPDGARQVNTDLSGALDARIDPAVFTAALADADAAVLGNLDLSRPLLTPAREHDVPIVVDLQDVTEDNPYDQDFVLAADVLVAGHERLETDHGEFLRRLRTSSQARLIVLTLGSSGSLALTPGDDQPWHVPALDVGPVNTTGAGDAFTAGLAHFLLVDELPPRAAVRAATAVAGLTLARPDQPVTATAVADVLVNGSIGGGRRVRRVR